MENKQYLSKLCVLLFWLLLSSPSFVFAYSPETTHAALTQEIVKFFSHYFPDKELSKAELEEVIRGSIDEDEGIRAMYHFLDPVYNRGLVFGRDWRSSKDWAINTFAQAKYDPLYDSRSLGGIFASLFGAKTDHSWDRAIYEYVWGDQTRGLRDFGHILHLTEDATVPDHTRNDPHPPYFGFDESPYEHWTKRFGRSNLKISDKLIRQGSNPYIASNIESYFDLIASYSNSNFFSQDTIFSVEYIGPSVAFWKTEVLGDGLSYDFGFSTSGVRLVAARVKSWREAISENSRYILNDPDDKILTDYWERLSEQAVINGAGVVKLFFDEVEKEKLTKALYNKNRSWVAKMADAAKGHVFNLASALYGITVPYDVPDLEVSPVLNVAPVPVEVLPTPATHQAAAALDGGASATAPAPDSGLRSAPQATPLPSPPSGQSQPPQNAPAPPPASRGASTPNTPPTSPADGGGATSAATPPPPPPAPPPDTTPPDISLAVAPCADSLSPSGCLVATTTLGLAWSSTAVDLDHFVVECNTAGIPCAGFPYSGAATTSAFTAENGSRYAFLAKAVDTAGNESQFVTQAVEVNVTPVVINEVAWAGTAASTTADEWIVPQRI